MSDKGKSAIAIELEKRAKARPLHFFDAKDFCSPTSTWTSRVAIRVAMKGEEMGAIVAGAAHLKRLADGKEIGDIDLQVDNRTLHILWTIVRDGTPREGMTPEETALAFPAFESPAWMAQNLTNDEIAKLLNLANVVIARESPLETKNDPDTFDRYAMTLGACASLDAARVLLANVQRQWLEEFTLIVCERLKDARGELEAKQAFTLVPISVVEPPAE